MLSKYTIKSSYDFTNALKEVFQEIALLGLYRGDFFNKAAFYGGTALRILYGLDRFSEDLDFSLLKKDSSFKIEKYFPYITDEFRALGLNVKITKKHKKRAGNISSAFLKNDTSLHSLDINWDNSENIFKNLKSEKQIKIKFEIDINPPLNFQTEIKTMLMPTTFNVVSMTIPNLYAGKLHALLFRKWKNRVKGRDWYDFEWYVKRGAELNLEHLQERMVECGNLYGNDTLNKIRLKSMMIEKIENLDIKKAREEVKPFLRDSAPLEFWTKDYFNLLVDKMTIM